MVPDGHGQTFFLNYSDNHPCVREAESASLTLVSVREAESASLTLASVRDAESASLTLASVRDAESASLTLCKLVSDNKLNTKL